MNLKDQVGQDFVKQLAQTLAMVEKKFDAQKFQKDLLKADWAALELKDRWRFIAKGIHDHLNFSYEKQIGVLKQVAPEYSGLAAMVFPEFVDQFGRGQWHISLPALEFLTQYSTGEFAVRWYILEDQARMLKQMQVWANHDNHHVRRLASEGCRPRLPWSFKLPALIENPKPILPILQSLKADDSLYVRKSVANNLNDISKDHPPLALQVAQQWHGKNEATDWIVRHGMRTLLKKGEKKALTLFGVQNAKLLAVEKLACDKNRYKIGGQLSFEFVIDNQAKSAQKIRCEYVIHFAKKNGKQGRKVFKVMEKNFSPGKHPVQKKHSLRQMTTRQHYPGQHQLDVLLNGEVKATTFFQLAPA
jgi:3-methyladenine DNA glycosylase AlkC